MFDMYGVSPSFYLQGYDRTVTWMGCLCSLLMVGLMAWISSSFVLEYVGEKNLIVDYNRESSQKYPFADLKEKKFLIILTPIYGDTNPYKGQLENFFVVKIQDVKSTSDIPIPGALPYQLQRVISDPKSCTNLVTDFSEAKILPEDL